MCTLLYKLLTIVLSDSFTACPEGFEEFYKQRRRWMPSTLANIMDLLGEWGKRVRRNNEDISFIYICYQIMLMIGTIIGPGSIFLMISGSFEVGKTFLTPM